MEEAQSQQSQIPTGNEFKQPFLDKDDEDLEDLN